MKLSEAKEFLMRSTQTPVIILSIFAVLAAAAPAEGQAVNQGEVIEGLRMKSSVLGRIVNYAGYLPHDY